MNLFVRKNKKDDEMEDPFVIGESQGRGSFLNNKRQLEWIEENMENVGPTDRVRQDEEPKEFLGVALGEKRLNIFLVCLFLLLGVVLGKIFYLQIIKGNEYRTAAEGNRIRTEIISAERGIIYDRNLVPLVKNIPSFSLYLIPGDLPGGREETKREEAITRISGIVKIDEREIKEKLKNTGANPYSFVLLAENIGYEDALRIKIESASVTGISLRTENGRAYLNNGDNAENKMQSLSHILGYVGKIDKEELEADKSYAIVDYIGKTGIEVEYEDILRGKSGKKQVEADALGKEKNVVAKEDPISGKNIILTLDVNLQKKLEDILTERIGKINKKRAAAIVLNPQNGKILAMVSLPTFDNNLFAQGISSAQYKELTENPDKPLFNRAIMGEYPSGSTIKPAIAAAALEEGVIKKNTTILSVGGISVGSWFFPDWRVGGHGIVNVTKALANSVNTFFYMVGGGYNNFQGLGVERIVKYAKLFGFGSSLGIDLPDEAGGFLPTKEWKEKTKGEPWYIGDTYHLAIGQGDLTVTPLQIAAMTSVFANGGTLFRPHLLESIESPKPIDETKNIIRQNFINASSIDTVRQGMRRAVTSGSAQKLLVLPVTSAGKTGTAQWNTNKSPHAWFTAFAPYENAEVVITVLVEEGIEGSVVALDVARDFLMWYFTQNVK